MQFNVKNVYYEGYESVIVGQTTGIHNRAITHSASYGDVETVNKGEKDSN